MGGGNDLCPFGHQGNFLIVFLRLYLPLEPQMSDLKGKLHQG